MLCCECSILYVSPNSLTQCELVDNQFPKYMLNTLALTDDVWPILALVV